MNTLHWNQRGSLFTPIAATVNSKNLMGLSNIHYDKINKGFPDLLGSDH